LVSVDSRYEFHVINVQKHTGTALLITTVFINKFSM